MTEEEWKAEKPSAEEEAEARIVTREIEGYPEPDLVQRITDYLASGGLFNPEMAIHDRVRDLLIDCRAEITVLQSKMGDLETQRKADIEAMRSVVKDAGYCSPSGAAGHFGKVDCVSDCSVGHASMRVAGYDTIYATPTTTEAPK